ncbi:MAG: T9SS type A sorting domain-containing protein, partial [Bacteroidia bacterium]|nr:T9SS type A sorting domain-containing protein [Bacteroidia bacterium]
TIYLTDPSAVACVDSVAGLTATCVVTPPGCTVAIDTASAACVTDTTFAITVSFTGAGPYTISDNKGTAPLTGLAGGTYTFGTYASNTVVTIYLTDPSAVACVDSVAGLTATCVVIPIVCGVTVDTLYADCASDTSFTIFVQFSGVGSNFQISDDQGTTPIGGLTAGLYSFGNYFNSTEVLITVTDLTLVGCDTTVGPVTADCTPVAVCDLAVDTSFATCVSDSTFTVSVQISGSGQFYQVFDNQGSVPFFPASAGTYVFGPFLNGTPVTVSISDLAIFNCFEFVGPITETCGSGGFTLPSAEIWATAGEDYINVSWQAVRPSLISGFFLQRSVDPEFESDWQTIAWVPVNLPMPLPAIFEYADQQVTVNLEYSYRVKIIPALGAEIMSNIANAMIDVPSGIWVGDFYPNPVINSEINFGVRVPVTGEMKWMLYDATGALVLSKVEKALAGQQIYTLELQGLTPGFYFLQVWYEGMLIRSKKILIFN